MKSRDHADEIDDELFRQAVSDVKKLHRPPAVAAPIRLPKPPIPLPVHHEAPAEFGEELRFLRPGIQTAALQKLRRGQYPIEATLDLHGATAAEAGERLQRFLQQSKTAGRTAVRIIHGKGYGSAGRQPVLKSKVRQELQNASFVLAFCSAQPRNGGTGAVDVLLAKSKSRRVNNIVHKS